VAWYVKRIVPISFSESSPFKDLRRPPALCSCCAASGLRRRRPRRPRSFASGCSSFAWSSFRVLRSLEAGEGLAPFSIADAFGAFASDPGGRGKPDEREKRRPGAHGAKARGLEDKNTPIDSTSGKNASASKEPDPVSSLSSGRAPALHACEVSHDACLCSLIPSIRPIRGGCGRFPSGACQAPFVQRWFTYNRIPIVCQGNSEKNLCRL
jgi:hypothetical protein